MVFMKTISNCIKKQTCRIATIVNIVCCFVFLQGCETVVVDNKPAPAPKTKSYVRCFTLIDDVLFYIIDDDVFQESSLPFMFKGERIFWDDSAGRFDSLIKHFGDTAYYVPTYGLYEAIADEFISADLTGDRDFDPSHPAGKSLNDIVKFHGISPYRYITSRYTNQFDWNNRNNIPEGFDNYRLSPQASGYHPVFKLLSELTLDDFKLLGQSFNLSFTVAPPLGEHNFTLTFKTATKEIKRTKKIIFN